MKTYVGWRNQSQELKVTVVGHDGKRHQLQVHPSLKVRNHSPTGFECGYGGSGPAQLALAMLMDACQSLECALLSYQQFKGDLVARLPKDGWEVTGQEIELWLGQPEVQAQLWRAKFDGAKAVDRCIDPPGA